MSNLTDQSVHVLLLPVPGAAAAAAAAAAAVDGGVGGGDGEVAPVAGRRRLLAAARRERPALAPPLPGAAPGRPVRVEVEPAYISLQTLCK